MNASSTANKRRSEYNNCVRSGGVLVPVDVKSTILFAALIWTTSIPCNMPACMRLNHNASGVISVRTLRYATLQ